MAQRIQHRRDTSANWTAANPVLTAGEVGIELHDTTGLVVGFKVGDGTTAWNALGRYATMADVQAAIAALVDGAPGLLDTLNELAAAIGDDPNFINTLAAQQAATDQRVRESTMAVVKHGLNPAAPRPADAPATYWIGDTEPLLAREEDLVRLEKNLLTGDDLLLKEATALWDTRAHDGSELLKDLSGNGHHLQMGSTHIARLMGEEGLLLPGKSERYASLEPNSSYQTHTTIDYRFDVELADRSSDQTLAGYGDRSIFYSRSADNRLVYAWYDGSNHSIVLPVMPTTERVQIRFEVNHATGAWTLYRRESGDLADNHDWDVMESGNHGLAPSTDQIGTSPARWQIGAMGHSNPGTGRIAKGSFYRARLVRNGSVVLDADFTKAPEGATSFTEDARGATVTINGTTGADTNDPLWLPLAEDEDPYLYLPGTAWNGVLTPHRPEFAFTEFDLRWFGTLGPSINRGLICKAHTDGNQRSLQWYVDGNSHQRLVISSDGANEPSQSDAVALPRDTLIGLRVTWRQSDGQVVFYQATDPSSPDTTSWTQTAVQTLAYTMFQTTQPLEVGARSNSTNMNHEGQIHRAQIYNGIDGTLVADFDPSRSRQPHRNFVDSVGNVWTINRSTSGRKAALVDTPMFLFGTDDYMETPDHDDLDFDVDQNATVVVAYRMHTTTRAWERIIEKKVSGGIGWAILLNNTHRPYTELRTASTTLGSQSIADLQQYGDVSIAGFVINNRFLTTIQDEELQETGQSLGAGSLSNNLPLRIASQSSSVGDCVDMEFIGAAIFRRALTDTEIAKISRHFGWTPHQSLLDEAVVAAVAGVTDSGVGLVDITGRGHNFKLGSTASVADTNDPLVLPFDGEKYAYVPGVTGNYLSTPASPAINITGDLELGFIATPNASWAQSSFPHMIGRSNDEISGIHYGLYISSDGAPELRWYDPVGAASRATRSSAVLPSNANGCYATLDIDNGAGGHTVKFFYTTNKGLTWTQLGSDRNAGAFVTSLGSQDSTIPLFVGARTSGQSSVFTGKIYRAWLKNGIGGATVAEFIANSATEPYATVVGGAGETWTFNRSASGRKLTVVDQNLLLFGTDDYAETPDDDELDFGAGDSFSVLLLMRGYGVPSNDYESLFSKRDTSTTGVGGWEFGTGLVTLSDGTNTPSPAVGDATNGGRNAVALVRDVSADQVRHHLNELVASVADTTTAAISNATPVALGRRYGDARYANYEVMGVAIIRRALTAAELTTLATELINYNKSRDKRMLARPTLRPWRD